ncbi:MAG: GIY-YIG nuclease family protein [bacterium]
MGFWVYMLRCVDGSYYTGHTDDLERRMADHIAGIVPGYVTSRMPASFMFAEELPTREEALARERQIKGWSRAKKEALIRGDWSEISRLAKARRNRQ